MFKKITFIVLAAALAFAPVFALAHGTAEPTADEGWSMMPHSGTWSMMGGFAPLGWLFFICWIGWIVIEVLVIIWLWQKITEK